MAPADNSFETFEASKVTKTSSGKQSLEQTIKVKHDMTRQDCTDREIMKNMCSDLPDVGAEMSLDFGRHFRSIFSKLVGFFVVCKTMELLLTKGGFCQKTTNMRKGKQKSKRKEDELRNHFLNEKEVILKDITHDKDIKPTHKVTIPALGKEKGKYESFYHDLLLNILIENPKELNAKGRKPIVSAEENDMNLKQRQSRRTGSGRKGHVMLSVEVKLLTENLDKNNSEQERQKNLEETEKKQTDSDKASTNEPCTLERVKLLVQPEMEGDSKLKEQVKLDDEKTTEEDKEAHPGLTEEEKLDDEKITKQSEHDSMEKTSGGHQENNTTTKCYKHDDKEVAEKSTQTDTEEVTDSESLGNKEKCKSNEQRKMKEVKLIEKKPVNDLKLEPSFRLKSDELAKIKTTLIPYQHSNGKMLSSDASKQKHAKPLTEVVDGLTGKSKMDMLTQIFSTRNMANKPETIYVYMQPSVGDIPWPWLTEEKWRVSTFLRYPTTSAKSALNLAASGFVYIGSGSDDLVECFFCHKTKKDWHAEDDIQNVHRLLSPNCPIVTGRECGNVPCSTLQSQNSKPQCQGFSPAVGENCSTPQQKDTIETDSALDANQPPSLPRDRTQQTPQASSDEIQPNSSHLNVERAQVSTSQISSFQIPTPTLSQACAPVTVPSLTSATPNTNPSSSTHQPLTTSTTIPMSTEPMQCSHSTSQTSQTTTSITAHSSQTSATSSESNHPPAVSRPTYNDLNIITERPKRSEYAVRQSRYNTFESWPPDHHISKDTLAAAGFYYAGYSDCARCFYCGGGLRNWEDNDDVWVEHARWFPKCAFMKQTLGLSFIKAVEDLNKDHDEISFEMVTTKMGVPISYFNVESNSNDTALKKDPAVRTIVEMGYSEDLVLEVARDLKDKDIILSADLIFNELQNQGHHISQASQLQLENIAKNPPTPEAIENLRDQNNQLRQQTLCKICMVNEVTIVFLPCGHLVSCTECATAMKDCPICRVRVKGIVRAFLK